MKPIVKLLATPALILLIVLQSAASFAQPRYTATPKDQTIRLALLLDTSNSMDGLIDQAKSQLWKIVNELAAAKCPGGTHPAIRISIYEYGNSRLSGTTGYIRMVSPLTGDLDLISEKLFSLSTDGGEEYCGQVIKTSLNQLEWSANRDDLNLIFIAGNEPFTQGSVSYTAACSLAKEKGIVVNTIFCGSFDEGIQTEWKRGADLTGGTYMSIEQNRKTIYIATPYDDQITTKNDELNSTYVYYGKSGADMKENQIRQDDNSLKYSKSNKVERAASKASSAYQNSVWDLVDAQKNSDRTISTVPESELPEELKGKTVEQKKDYVQKKAEDRARIQKEITDLNIKRKQYIAANTKTKTAGAVLEDVMVRAIHTKGIEKGMSWE